MYTSRSVSESERAGGRLDSSKTGRKRTRQKDASANTKPRGSKVEDLREDLAEQRRDLDTLAGKVDSVLRAEDWIQAKLYDLTHSLEALVQALPETGSESEPSSPLSEARDPTYSRCVRQVREAVRKALPPDATVIVVSKGDEEILDLYGREAWHFPQDQDGEYRWYYPPDGAAPIAHLEALRVRGGQYLLFPEPAFWWLKRYPKFTEHLRRRYEVAHEDESCVIFELEKKSSPTASDSWKQRLTDLFAECASNVHGDPSILDCDSRLALHEVFPTQAVLDPPDDDADLPYIDRSIDIVVLNSSNDDAPKEARRVARYAIVTVEDEDIEPSVEYVGDAATRHALPSASIIIPTYDGVEHLETCLVCLDETLPESFNGEVIVVDDGSGPAMQKMLEGWKGSRLNLQVVRNPKNCGFLASCNRGAHASKGDVLIFLNDDTLPQAGWLEALLRTFREYPDAGAVGSRLLYPDGRLQEAGGLVFRDGSAANFGRDDFLVEHPLYNHVREVDYCSGAALATPRSLFTEIGGFDKRFEPGYYEDTDYCFEVRKHKGRVYYQPESVVIHTEGGTGGTDLTAGAKRYQVVNQGKFEEKWKEALRKQPERPEPLDKNSYYDLVLRGQMG
jgi:GT2 family glycosyltransferase